MWEEEEGSGSSSSWTCEKRRDSASSGVAPLEVGLRFGEAVMAASLVEVQDRLVDCEDDRICLELWCREKRMGEICS